jgi:hypothetical protein
MSLVWPVCRQVCSLSVSLWDLNARKQRFLTLVLPDVLLIISQTFSRVRTGVLSQDCEVLETWSALETQNGKVRYTR